MRHLKCQKQTETELHLPETHEVLIANPSQNLLALESAFTGVFPLFAGSYACDRKKSEDVASDFVW